MERTSPGIWRVAVLLLLVCAAIGLLAGSAASSGWDAEERRLVDRINAERRAAGLGSLQVDAELQRVARAWTDVMAQEDRLYHNPNLSSQVQGSWERLGENVGWRQQPGASSAALVDGVHQAFMDSPGHRANVLRPEFGWVGVGVRVTATGRLWTTVTFMQGAGSAPAPAPAPLAAGEFRDVAGGTHAPAIKAIALKGITQGCTEELFCPTRQVTRAQMAAFLSRALDLAPAPGANQFADVAGSTHAAAINALASAGITGGCGDGLFCPNQPVSRSQMASFLQRAWELPVPTIRRFTDVVASVHQPAIDAIAEAGITLGCAEGLFCPNKAVSRAEMASFLARALNLV